MRRVTVTDAAGRPLKITLLTDWDLLFCVPYSVVSFLYRIMRIGLYLVVQIPISAVMVTLTKCNVSLIWSIICFPILIAGASAMTATGGAFSSLDLVGAVTVFLIGAALMAKVLMNSPHFEDARIPSRGKLSPSEVAAVARIRAEAATLPDSCVRNTLDKSILYVGFVRTLLFVPALICAVLLPASWVAYALDAYVVLFVFNDFELIEHISAHAPNGRLLIAQNAPWWARFSESLRRYVVWPLFGWFPDMYFVTHAMHHHVENNGPADWQSTLRYDRASLLDFTKLVTWFGMNIVLPFETVSYMTQRRGLRFKRFLIRGAFVYLILFTILALANPLLFLLLAADIVFAGFGSYRFFSVWHGFHDAGHPYDIEAGNQSLLHYAHHAQPHIHLRDFDNLGRVAQNIEKPSCVAILRPEFEARLPFWRLQGLLWSKDFESASECLVEHSFVTALDMERDERAAFFLRRGLVGRGLGAGALKKRTASFIHIIRPRWLEALDNQLSKAVGKIVSGRRPRPANET
jgi:hypothetical protein